MQRPHPARSSFQKKRALIAALLVSVVAGPLESAQPTAAVSDSLRDGFRAPPMSARPRVWWHWLNGNITKDGIRKDIEWMSRVGIGGLQNFDAALTTPQIVDHRIVYMTPEWQDAFRYAATLAESHGMELATAASPGWSETGGPWVKPQDAMKKLVWSETVIPEGRRFNGILAPLPDMTGPYQTIAAPQADHGLNLPPPPVFGQQIRVIAYRMADAAEPPAPRLTSTTGEALDPAPLMDESYDTGIILDRGTPDRPGFLKLDYDRPQTIQSATIFIPGAANIFFGASLRPTLEASADGTSWRRVADFPLSLAPTTISFVPVTASHFRVVLNATDVPLLTSVVGGGAPGAVISPEEAGTPPTTAKITELRLLAEPRINAFELKAGFSLTDDYYALDRDTGPDIPGLSPADIVDLTDQIDSSGHLDWTPPPGRWKVIRFGYSLVGTTNHPATPEATGLEVDKYDGRAVHDYLETYIGMYTRATGPDLIGKQGLRALLTDSIEVGASNWTPDLIAQFKRLRGYDPLPWMPALAGVVVSSRSRSEAFLYDFRRTLADLISSQHYGQVAATAHEHDLKLYGEALEGGRPSLGDDMTMRSHTDVPMAALWTYGRDKGPYPVLLADMKGAASVAHVYGQNLAAAESMTTAFSPWAFAPSDLKPVIDLEFAYGINRPVIHTSVHQPVDDKVPGLSLRIFGQYFNRHETWAEMARPWIDYIARNGFMLQQGRYFADVGYFYGEEAPLTGLYRIHPVADAPTHYAYDFVSADALLTQLRVDGSELVASGGARYRVLYLGGSSRRMTLAVLAKLAEFANAGATIVGNAPQGSPSLDDDPARYAALVRRLWSGMPVTTVGRGRVIAGNDVEQALTSIGLGADFNFAGALPDSQVLFLHRRLDDADVYFLSNRAGRPDRGMASFRVTGKVPEIWHADTGTSEPVSYQIKDGRTVIPLDLQRDDSFFVVFRHPASSPSATYPRTAWRPVAPLNGPWDISFQAGRGAPASARFERLHPLSEDTQPGIKYFSGTASYRRTFELPRGVKPGDPLRIDLGKIGDVAEIWINGQKAGTVWKAPYQLDIGANVRRGTNMLEVRVADLWVNRLIGDAQPGVATKITYTTLPTYKPDAPLRASGLIGPIVLLTPSVDR